MHWPVFNFVRLCFQNTSAAVCKSERALQSVMGDDGTCRKAVEQFAADSLAAKVGTGLKLAKHKNSEADKLFDAVPQRKATPGAGTSGAPAPASNKASPRTQPVATEPAQTAATSSAAHAAQASAPQHQQSAAQPAVKASAVTVKSAPQGRKRGTKQGGGQPSAPRRALAKLERQVFNCLSCGKVQRSYQVPNCVVGLIHPGPGMCGGSPIRNSGT